MPDIHFYYEKIKLFSAKNLGNQNVTSALIDLIKESLIALRSYPKIQLTSNIANKAYFIYDNNGKYSRPVNLDLFIEDIPDEVYQWYQNLEWNKFPNNQLQRFLYTISMSYCAAKDSLGGSDKKSPSIFFEILIGNIFARVYSVNPSKKINV